MNHYITLALYLLAFFVVVNIIKFIFQKKQSIPYASFVKRNDFLSIAERNFFSVLFKAMGEQYYIFTQVGLSRLIRDENNKQANFNRIRAKSIDFVLCDKTNVSPVLAIELNDSSHGYDSRRERDEFLAEVLQQAGLPFLQIRVQGAYNLEELRMEIGKKLNLS